MSSRKLEIEIEKEEHTKKMPAGSREWTSRNPQVEEEQVNPLEEG